MPGPLSSIMEKPIPLASSVKDTRVPSYAKKIYSLAESITEPVPVGTASSAVL